ncbi:response regulator [Couchioplanes caeruleus]|uniref:response regulator transcription factor n=1 Tax=Couchioplanes caeruleus TaxID=56438 RepID=UPI00201C0C96|nr:response regulator [Couchioplanes caeruleus]UQU65520.1 response regulator [Couchioplanes caeruleus]
MNENLILVAEDDPDLRDMITYTLERAGYTTVGAKDGSTAARIIRVAHPIGIVTDVRMPALNGMELCQLVRQDPESRNAAVLMVSANSHLHDINAGLHSGADGYLPKPLSPRRLVAELEGLIARRRMIDS